ncbi:MAG: 16S rRNA (guanine(966)-N(2))-methyltransferase RsmD [Terriglobales bacterium]
MRVIAGKFRSRRLQSLPGMELRPTSDRLRETLFDVLTAGNPAALEGTVWIDLFAGTGAVGLEALSRGAAQVYFVESEPRAAELIRKNLLSLGITGGFQVLSQDALRALQAWGKSGIQANYIFMDPPYAMEAVYGQTLAALSSSACLRSEAIVMVEHQKKFDPGGQTASLQRYRLLKQGDAALSFYRRT